MWKSLWDYFRKMWKIVGIFLLFGGIFALVLILYGIHPEPVVYALILCGVLGAVFLVVDFVGYVRRQERLCELKENLFLSHDSHDSAIFHGSEAAQYEAMISSLQEECKRLERQRLQDYEEMKDYYTMWAHQIKTPIAAMRLLLQAQEGEQNKALEMELFKIEQYVEMVLGYLRTENISTDMRLENCELDGIIRQAVKKYAKIFVLKKISLNYETLTCQVLTDKKWLSFVLEQILSNALKYTKTGSISIYLAPDKEKTLVIQDTGIGIRPEDLPRIFERGFTGCNGREERRSTGIGLYSSKRIMDKLGHRISVESQMGEGTKVLLGLERKELELL